jgi:hypothetical protein
METENEKFFGKVQRQRFSAVLEFSFSHFDSPSSIFLSFRLLSKFSLSLVTQ